MASSGSSDDDAFIPDEDSDNDSSSSYRKNKKRSKFTLQEDNQLRQAVVKFGIDHWSEVSQCLKQRSPRQCRDRWRHYLCPVNNFSNWSKEEDDLLMRLHSELGHHWARIAEYLPRRTSSGVRNRICKLMRHHSKEILKLKTLKRKYVTKSTKLEDKKKQEKRFVFSLEQGSALATASTNTNTNKSTSLNLSSAPKSIANGNSHTDYIDPVFNSSLTPEMLMSEYPKKIVFPPITSLPFTANIPRPIR